jgi:hypothetical protein
MDNKRYWYRPYDTRGKQVWEDLVNRIGKSMPVADLDYLVTYMGTGAFQHGIVGDLLKESFEVAKGAEQVSINDGLQWGNGKMTDAAGIAGRTEVGHTSACASGANEKQVGGSHYLQPIQHWDYVVANNMPYLEAQVLRYVGRHTKKGGRADLEKAKHFIDKMIEVYYPNK